MVAQVAGRLRFPEMVGRRCVANRLVPDGQHGAMHTLVLLALSVAVRPMLLAKLHSFTPAWCAGPRAIVERRVYKDQSKYGLGLIA